MSRPFADVVRDLAGGMTYQTLSDSLAEVVDAVMETGKPGTMTLKLKVLPNGENSIFIEDHIDSKIPQGTRGKTLFFTTQGGILVREDPRQHRLPLRDASEPATQPAAAGEGT